MDAKQKDIIITIQVSPVSGGKRKVLISGAPEQEMPIVRAGVFADMNRLLGEVWIELQKRKPQVVKVPKEKTEKSETKPAATNKSDGKQSCRVCGCTNEKSCDPECHWVEPDLCSNCVGKEPAKAEEPDQAPDPVEKAFDEAGGNLEPAIPDPEEPQEEQLPLIEGDTDG